MSALPDLAACTAAAVGLLWGCGLLVARFLAPRRCRVFLPLLAPFLGFALVSAVAHYLGALGYPLRSARWLFVALAAAGWAVTLADRRLRRVPRSSLAPLIVCLLAYLLAVAPLLELGYLTTVGGTIDGISYAVRSEYLQDAPPRLPEILPGKPYLGWVQSQIELLRIGDVYVVGLLGLYTGRRSYELLTIVAALFFALTAGSLFVWARSTLRLRPGAALLAASLAGISNLLLWPVYDNFLSQAIAVGFLPLLLWAGVGAERLPGVRQALLFGALLATLASVYPVYAAYGLAAVLCHWAVAGVVGLQRGGGALTAVRGLRWWLGALVAAAAWNGIALLRGGSELGSVIGILSPGGRGRVGPGNILVFPPVSEVLGLVAHAAEAYGEGWRVPAAVRAPLGAAFACVAAYGWWRLGRRARLAAATVLLTCAALAAQQRWGINPPHGYPYGWFKAICTLAPQTLALVAAGIAALWRLRRGHRLAAGAALLLIAVNARHTLWAQRFVLAEAVLADRELIEAARVARRVQPGAWTMIDIETGLRQHWLGYLLRDQKIRYRGPLWLQDVPTPGAGTAFVRYALVERALDERRLAWLDEPWYDADRYARRWGNGRYELRERRDTVLAELSWERRWPPGRRLGIDLSAREGLLRSWLGGEARQSGVQRGQPRTAQIRVYGLSPVNRLAVSGAAPPVILEAGGWVLDFDLECLSTREIAIDHLAGDALLADVRFLGAGTGALGACLEVVPLATGTAYVEQEVLAEGRVRLRGAVVRPLDGSRHAYRLGFHVADPAAPKLFGVWSLDFPPGARVRVGTLDIDLRDRSSAATLGGAPAPVVTGSFDVGAGTFQAVAAWWQLDPVDQLQVEPLLWFQRTPDGTVTVTRAVPRSRLAVLAAP